MKTIDWRHVAQAWCTAAAGVVSLVLGFVYPVMLAGALAALLVYRHIDKKYLRCKYCGAFINLDRLTYAKTHEAYCLHCGGPIKISVTPRDKS